MKIKFFVFILMIFMVISFSSCEKDLSKMNEEQIINTLKKEYIKQYVKESYQMANKSWITDYVYFGEYNNAYIMEFYVDKLIYTADIKKIDIAGYTFVFNYNYPDVYKEGKIYILIYITNLGDLII